MEEISELGLEAVAGDLALLLGDTAGVIDTVLYDAHAEARHLLVTASINGESRSFRLTVGEEDLEDHAQEALEAALAERDVLEVRIDKLRDALDLGDTDKTWETSRDATVEASSSERVAAQAQLQARW